VGGRERAWGSPAGLLHGREVDLARAVLLSTRWLARNVPAPEPLLRNVAGRTLFAGPMLGKPWRCDPAGMIEQTRLLAAAPGFDATVPETTDRQVAGLAEIRCPVLVLWGTKDVVLFPPRQALRAPHLNCEVRHLKGLGHVPMLDDPELLAEAIADFALPLARPRPLIVSVPRVCFA
jgi:pimeloyl-ACP methyl ester carboxylesterase